MYFSTIFSLRMLRELYDNKNIYLLNIIQLSILTGLLVSKDMINTLSVIYLTIFIYLVHSIFIASTYLIAFFNYLKQSEI